MARPKKTTKTSRKQSNETYFEKLENQISTNNSTISLVLGFLIVVVAAVLLFNYFKTQKSELGPSQQTETGDVSPDNLPGKYTVKDGDTLFTIADKYYKDGYKFSEIAKANNLADVNSLEVGQVLEIPKLEGASPAATTEAQATPMASSAPVVSAPSGEKGAAGPEDTIWGPAITGNTYTVQEGDWLSTIAARAYGDVLAYQKLAQVNNIANPNLILPGQVINIPR